MKTANHIISSSLSGRFERVGEHATVIPLPSTLKRKPYGPIPEAEVTFRGAFLISPVVCAVVEFGYKDRNGPMHQLPVKFRFACAFLGESAGGEKIWVPDLNQKWVSLPAVK